MSVQLSDGEFEDGEIDEFCVVALKKANHENEADLNIINSSESEVNLTQVNADMNVIKIVLTQPVSCVRWKIVRYESSVVYLDIEDFEDQQELLSGSDAISQKSVDSPLGSTRQRAGQISSEQNNLVVVSGDLSSESIKHMRSLLVSQTLQKAAKYSNLIEESEEFEVQELLEGIGQIGLKADAKISGSEFDGQELEDIE